MKGPIDRGISRIIVRRNAERGCTSVMRRAAEEVDRSEIGNAGASPYKTSARADYAAVAHTGFNLFHSSTSAPPVLKTERSFGYQM